MLISTPGIVLHTTPYGEASVVARIFTRQVGTRSYIVKGVRSAKGRVKQNLLQPLTCLDMVVYDNHRQALNYIKELSPRHPIPMPDAVGNTLRFFMTEVLYRSLREEEPMPELWDYVELSSCSIGSSADKHTPIRFLLDVVRLMGSAPLDNMAPHTPLFDLQEGRYVPTVADTTLSPTLSLLLHLYQSQPQPQASADERSALLDALLIYCNLHLSGFGHFSSLEILHTILR